MPVTGRPVGVRRLSARRASDRGGVAVIVAVLVGSGVLFGMAALVVDVGNMHAERGRLQNGADAAAVKVAQVCARDAADCTASTADSLADRYARDNAFRGEAGARACGRGGDLPACPAPSGGLPDCIGSAPASGDYVEVHANTLHPDGSTLLPPVFADAVLGGGFQGAAITACARVAWGAPARARGIAMTISICDWRRYTNDGAAFPPVEQAIPLYDGTDPTACGVAGTSSANRGGFRWLDDANPACLARVSVGGSYDVRSGEARPGGCPEALTGLLDSPRPVLVPIFDSVAAGGGNATHTVQGFGAFVVTGWHLPDSDYPSDTRSSCDNGETSCVFGYFTQALVPGGGAVGGPDMGATIVAPIG